MRTLLSEPRLSRPGRQRIFGRTFAPRQTAPGAKPCDHQKGHTVCRTVCPFLRLQNVQNHSFPNFFSAFSHLRRHLNGRVIFLHPFILLYFLRFLLTNPFRLHILYFVEYVCPCSTQWIPANINTGGVTFWITPILINAQIQAAVRHT